jgi:hypothetical protein
VWSTDWSARVLRPTGARMATAGPYGFPDALVPSVNAAARSYGYYANLISCAYYSQMPVWSKYSSLEVGTIFIPNWAREDETRKNIR